MLNAGPLFTYVHDPRSIHFPSELDWIVDSKKGFGVDLTSSPNASPARLSHYQTQSLSQWLNTDLYQVFTNQIGPQLDRSISPGSFLCYLSMFDLLHKTAVTTLQALGLASLKSNPKSESLQLIAVFTLRLTCITGSRKLFECLAITRGKTMTSNTVYQANTAFIECYLQICYRNASATPTATSSA